MKNLLSFIFLAAFVAALVASSLNAPDKTAGQTVASAAGARCGFCKCGPTCTCGPDCKCHESCTCGDGSE